VPTLLLSYVPEERTPVSVSEQTVVEADHQGFALSV